MPWKAQKLILLNRAISENLADLSLYSGIRITAGLSQQGQQTVNTDNAHILALELTSLLKNSYFWAGIPPTQLQTQRPHSVWDGSSFGSSSVSWFMQFRHSPTCAPQSGNRHLFSSPHWRTDVHKSLGKCCISHQPGWLHRKCRAQLSEWSNRGDGKERNRVRLLEWALPWKKHP